ncbi:hypothetical protein CCMA1212_009596 [Trichoderma ghanense]|uniref:Uncharacterized protein n=1 Tax=Trichoderma ghanense TaxID=65468 RepID=A0ABY2GTI2_9HYPO
MVTAVEHFPLSISPSSRKPAEPFLMGTGSNVCESSADDTLSTAGVVAVRLGPPDFAGRGHLASAAGHNSRHDLFDGSEERKGSRRAFGTAHSSSWTAPIAISPSNYAAGCAESVTTALISSHFPRKGSKDERQTRLLQGYCWSPNCLATNKPSSRAASDWPTAL